MSFIAKVLSFFIFSAMHQLLSSASSISINSTDIQDLKLCLIEDLKRPQFCDASDSKDPYDDSPGDLLVQNPNTLDYDQYLTLLANLDLTGVWYNTDNTTQEGNFLSKNYGFITFHAHANNTSNSSENSGDGSKVYNIEQIIYDGHTIGARSLTTCFYVQDLRFHQANSRSFSGDITVSQRFSDNRPNLECSMFLQMSFVDITTNSPLTQAQDFSNAGIQISMSNSNCSMSIVTNNLNNQPTPTLYILIYCLLMSLSLLPVTICEILVIRSFPLNKSQLKTMGLWGLFLLHSWQAFIFSINLVILTNFGNFWVLIPFILTLINYMLIVPIYKRYCAVVRQKNTSQNRKVEGIRFVIGLFGSSLLALIFTFFLTVSYNFCYVLLVSPLFLASQIINKYRNMKIIIGMIEGEIEGPIEEAKPYWLVNFLFFIPQIFFMVYFFVYEDNLLGIQTNLPLTITHLGIYGLQMIFIAYQNLEPRRDVQELLSESATGIGLGIEAH